VPRGKPWSGEEEQRLRELVEEGQSLEVIAAELGKSENAVYQKMKKLGLEKKKGGGGGGFFFY